MIALASQRHSFSGQGDQFERGIVAEKSRNESLDDVQRCCEWLIENGLVSSSELDSVCMDHPSGPEIGDVHALADALLQAGKLTSLQSEYVAAGNADQLKLDDYVLVERIGRGGMGEVFRAYHPPMKRHVAIKLLPRETVGDAQSVHRFHREVEAAARLEHPNIVRAYDAGESAGRHYLVMEHVDGNDLSQIVKRRGPLSVGESVAYALQAARGLSYAHRQGMLHRDIKSANLLVTRQGDVKILDMGLVSFASHATAPGGPADEPQHLTSANEILGTCSYMSPEQAFDPKRIGPASDVYSLGCTLFYILTARTPFSAPNKMMMMLAHKDDPVPSVCALRPDVPEGLDELIRKMLAKEPGDRFASMDDVAVALEALPDYRDDRIDETAGFQRNEDGTQAGSTEPKAETVAGLPASTSKESSSGMERVPALSRWKRGLLISCIVLVAIPGALVWLRSLQGDSNNKAQEGNAQLPSNTVDNSSGDGADTDGIGDIVESLQGEIDVRVWNPEDRLRSGLSLSATGALPLRVRDQIRIEAALNRPAFLYLIWIDSEGTAVPVYPWQPGDWDSRPPAAAQVRSLSLPQVADEGWEMRGSPGMETLLMLARDEQLPADFDLASRFDGLGGQKMQDSKSLVWFVGGEVVSETSGQLRAPNFFDPQKIDDPVLKTQRLLQERLRDHFDLIVAVSFAYQGE